jgi:hypothetical protein
MAAGAFRAKMRANSPICAASTPVNAAASSRVNPSNPARSSSNPSVRSAM